MLKNSLIAELLIAMLLVVAGIASREWLIAEPNFKPVGALAIFAGMMLSRWWLVAVTIVVMMGASDWMLGGPGLSLGMAVLVALLANAAMFRLMRSRLFGVSVGQPPAAVDRPNGAGRLGRQSGWAVMLVLAGTVQFFLTTNLACWMVTDWYTRDFAGLISCFVAGVPFFWRSLAGDLVFAMAPLLLLQSALALAAVRGKTAVRLPA